ncbi:caspase family protein [Amycolatopsis sp. NPDC059021]|uniref:caspase family protein n=1 Tax=Amycolatopsis sp. NPDC059021 TaxID=3346704 RepID=UPI00366DD86E
MRLADPLRSRAVLIGTSEFADPDLPALPAVRNNVTDLAAILTAPAGTGLPPAQCRTLLDEPDHRTVGDALEEAAEQAEDLLLVYYAGHGVLDGRGQLYLTMPDSTVDRLRWTGLPAARLRELLADAPAANRVLIVDSCFSGRAIGELMADASSAATGQLEIAGTYTLTSASGNETASAPWGARHTAFTGALTDLLTRGAPDGPELLTLDFVHRHLRRVLGERGLARPGQGGTQTTGRLALAPNPVTHALGAGVLSRLAAAAGQAARVLGPAHPTTLDSRRRHAVQVGLAGNPAEAARLHAELVTDFQRVFGLTHPDVFAIRESHAYWTGRAGQHGEAVNLLAALRTDRAAHGVARRTRPRRTGRGPS